MTRIPSRQVHLDFHTSEFIPGVGSRFSKENFQEALKLGNVNSITVFAKCHHSWCYYPSKIGAMHPTLSFDLTGAMIEAAHEIGVRTPVYITVGWSAKDAENHPEWVARGKDGAMLSINLELGAADEKKRPVCSWKYLCPNGGYGELIYGLTREVCDRYIDLDGLFYDINFRPICWCSECIDGMRMAGLDPAKDEDAEAYHKIKWQHFMTECRNILREKHKDATLFFNGGALPYKSEWHSWQTHFEKENLGKTVSGGYDYLLFNSKYLAHYGKDYVAMSGKFHTSWGEFGGYKTSEAMLYECASMMAFNARCSFGDQMHPCGEMDMETYRLIGEAYKYSEKIEPWCYDIEETTRLGVFSAKNEKSDIGLVKMLMENQLDFNFVHENEYLNSYDVLILPDSVILDQDMAGKLNTFVERGGGLVLTGKSGLDKDMKKFLINIGADYQEPSLYDIDYLSLNSELCKGLVTSPILFYEAAEQVCPTDGDVLAILREPYFNRTYGHYCSHQNTPYKLEVSDHPGAIRRGNVIYLAHPVCRLYFNFGMQFHRDYFINALNLIYKNPILKVKLPSSGRVHFVRQEKEKRYVLHLLYTTPVSRGGVLTIEDLPSIYNVGAEMRVVQNVKRVYLAPDGIEIPFKQVDGVVSVTVPVVKCHRMVVLDY